MSGQSTAAHPGRFILNRCRTATVLVGVTKPPGATMKTPFVRFLAIAALAGVALAACGSSSKSSSSSATTQPAPTPTATAAPGTTAASGGAGGSTVALAAVTSPKVPSSDKVLVDDKGRTLYVADMDKTKDKSACDAIAACVAAWPPYYVTGTPTYGTGLDAANFSVFMAPNGKQQLAVNGKPLYHWVADTAAGDAKGQDVNGFYVVGSDYKKVDEG
jgi:predicted lipoprotein with Yx(FWY)xxD motif